MITPGGGRGLAQSNARVTLSDGRPDAALAQVDEVLGVEREVKRAHITLLIQIKNTLSAEQQAKLAAAREGAARVGVRVY